MQELSKNLIEREVLPTELFAVGATKFYQSDLDEVFCIDWYGDLISFKLCDLIRFRNKINQIDLAARLTSVTSDIELVYLPHIDRILLLTLYDILTLKELFSGGFAMLELNSILHRAIHRKWA